MVCCGLRAGQRPDCSAANNSASRITFARTSRKLSNRTPSSSMVVLKGGMLPGVLPPMSAWWPRLAT